MRRGERELLPPLPLPLAPLGRDGLRAQNSRLLHCRAMSCLTLTLTCPAAKYSDLPFRGKAGQNQITFLSQVIRNIGGKAEWIHYDVAFDLQ